MVPSGTALDRCSLSVMATPARNRLLLQVCRTSQLTSLALSIGARHESEVRVLGLPPRAQLTPDDITPPLCSISAMQVAGGSIGTASATTAALGRLHQTVLGPDMPGL